MLQEQARALLTLSGINVTSLHRLENKYWPDNEHYAEIRRENPWWLAVTEFGPIIIGRRKRVWQVSWSDTKLRKKLLDGDDVTNEEEYVHAYTLPKLLECVMLLGHALKELKADSPNGEAV